MSDAISAELIWSVLKADSVNKGLIAYHELAAQGGFFFVATGLDNNFSAGTNYFTFRPFGGDATKAFIQANPHIFRPRVAAVTAAE